MSSRRVGPEFVEVEVERSIAAVGLAMPVFGLKAEVLGQVGLAEQRVDVVLEIVVLAEPVRLEVKLANAKRGSPEETGDRDLVAEGAVGARNSRPRSPARRFD